MTTCTRREFTRALALAAGAAAVPSAAAAAMRRRQAAAVFDWSPLAGTAARLCLGRGGNAVVVADAGEAVLIDCKNAGFGHSLRAEAESNGATLNWIVNTHHHADHTGGNYAFAHDIPLLAHRNAEPRIIANGQFDRYIRGIAGVGQNADMGAPADEDAVKILADAPEDFYSSGYSRLEPGDFAPTRLIDDEREVRVGDTPVQLRHRGPGHTDNDVFIYFPTLNLLHTGDLVFHNLHPFIDRPAGATTEGWIRSCKSMLDLCDDQTVVVPGHGDVGGRGAIRGQIEYFQKTRDAVQKAVDAGEPREAVVNMQFDHFDGMGFDQIRPRSVGAIYDELTNAPPQ